MNDPKYLKCSCSQCGGHIEFPAEGVGRAVNCPHCGLKTVLTGPGTASPAPGPAPAPETAPRRTPWALVLVVCGVLAGLAGAGIWAWTRTQPETTAPVPGPVARPAAPAATKPPADTAADGGAAPASAGEIQTEAKRPKSPGDLKVGAITLEKTPGNSLVYAVGTVRNISDYQRFGVKIQLDLINQAGSKIGTISDYAAIIEPGREWQFRALVTDPKGVRVSFANLSEDR